MYASNPCGCIHQHVTDQAAPDISDLEPTIMFAPVTVPYGVKGPLPAFMFSMGKFGILPRSFFNFKLFWIYPFLAWCGSSLRGEG
jgi:hypothetical protein